MGSDCKEGLSLTGARTLATVAGLETTNGVHQVLPEVNDRDRRRLSLRVFTGGSAPVEAAVKFVVDGVCLSELIFKDDDAARRV